MVAIRESICCAILMTMRAMAMVAVIAMMIILCFARHLGLRRRDKIWIDDDDDDDDD